MSKAEELLATLSETVSEHAHLVVDSETHFVIDPITREIDNSEHVNKAIMQRDHMSEKFTFEVPRYVEGHDMTLCNRVRVHYVNIDNKSGESYSDYKELDDLRVDPENPTAVICSWPITRYATQFAGTLNFLVQYMCVSDMGVVDYEWHSNVYRDLPVKENINSDETTLIEYTDIIEQWRAKLFGAGNSAVAEITLNAETQLKNIESEGTEQVTAVVETKDNAIAAIIAKGEETLATIPADYTETYNMANDALRTRANAIVVTTEGETVVADDCSDDYLRGLHVYGRTTQTSTTGKQLIQTTLGGTTAVTGLKISPLEDGDLVVNGVHAEGAMWLEFGRASLAAGKTYTLSCAEGFSLHLWDLTNNKEFRTKKLADEYITITATENIDCAVVLNDAVLGRTYVDVRVGAILSESSIPLPWEPYSGGFVSPSPEWPQDLANVENLSVELYGRNLLDQNGEFTSNYSTFSLKANVDHGEITVSGTSMLGYGTLKTSLPLGVFKKGLTYRLSRVSNNFHVGFWFYDKDNNNIGSLTTENSLAYTVPDYADHISFFYAGLTPETEVNLTEKFMLNLGTEALPWEPSVDTQSISLAHTLHGIPVDSGGNYTDANGQQWIADEIDFERGVYIQRTKLIDLTKVTTWRTWGINYSENGNVGFYAYDDSLGVVTDNAMCTLGKYQLYSYGGIAPGVKSTISGEQYYVVSIKKEHLADASSDAAAISSLKTLLIETDAKMLVTIKPVETNLTDEELFAFRQLHSNYLVTTALNSENAHMGLVYNADTKAYVDGKFNELFDKLRESGNIA